MSKDRLVIEEVSRGYTIAWFLADEQDIGATLGEGNKDRRITQADVDAASSDDWEHMAATLAAKESKGVNYAESLGFYWETRADATVALRTARAVLKTPRDRPWPEWALKAQAAGWKAPKGWQP